MSWSIIHSIAVLVILFTIQVQCGPIEGLNGSTRRNDNRTITDETLKELMEVARKYLAPNIKIAKKHLDYNCSILVELTTVTDVVITGVDKFKTLNTKADMESLHFIVEVSVPIVNATGHYKLNVESPYFYAFGDGPFSVNISDVWASVSINLGLTEKKTVEITDAYMDYKIGNIQIYLGNLLDGGEVADTINELINEIISDVVIEEKENLNSYFKSQMTGKTKIISALTLQDLIYWIYYIIDAGAW